MTIKVRRATNDDLAQWNELVRESNGGSFFHQIEVLEAISNHSSSDLVPLVGFKGQEPVGIFPIFVLSKGPIDIVVSPPPGLHIPSIGPVLLHSDNIKQRRLEKQNRRFIDGCLNWITENIDPKYSRILSVVDYDDIRPFSWNEFEVTPVYTYLVDLSVGEEALKKRFSSSRRRNVRKDEYGSFDIRVGDIEDLDFVINRTRERYEAQNEAYDMTNEFARELYNNPGDGDVTVYIGEIEGEKVGGIVCPRLDSTLYFWQGGGKPDVSIPFNDLIHWRIMRDSMEAGYSKYDLVGANTPRLCNYKSKFGPELHSYYVMERGSKVMDMASNIYKRFR